MNIKYIEKNNSTYIVPGETPVIRYKIFDAYPELVTGFSTRLGGVSSGYLSSMNLSFTRGDDREKVLKNHEIFAKDVGYDYKSLVFSDQVHDIQIKNVTKEDAGKGIMRESDIKDIDGLVTNVPGIPLITFYADCVPLYFYDPVKKVAALAHSGWRGTVRKIGAVMVQRMEEDYGCAASDIVCAIGPSICRSCYEVSSDVAEEFKKAYSRDIYEQIIDAKEDGKFQLDLQLACFYNFLSAGIRRENIAMPDICTCCNPDILFSHRATKGKRGNLAAVIMLK